MSSPSRADVFWTYSLAMYAKPGVAELCLNLQDEHGFDVNLLLLCFWIAEEGGRSLTVADIKASRDGASAVNDNLILPVRSARKWARRWLEAAPERIAEVDRRELYAALKAVELQGERFVQAALLGALPPDQAAPPKASPATVRTSLENYRQALAAPDIAAALLTQLVVRILA